MSRYVIGALILFLLWIAWCFLVLTVLVPAIRMHVTFWNWIMAWVLSVLPVILAAIVFLMVSNRRRLN